MLQYNQKEADLLAPAKLKNHIASQYISSHSFKILLILSK
jgi:hypothetical protein